jgi:branched-chain amino acid transport system permease protein
VPRFVSGPNEFLNLFLTELLAGITHGSVYALIALGYSMVYGILKLLNFAHGDIFMVGSFIGFGILTVFGGAAAISIPIGLLLALMFISAMLGGGLLGVVIERFAYRRLREAPRIAPLITALGVSFFLENAVLLVLGADYHSFDTFSWRNGELWRNGFTLWAGVHVAVAQIIVITGAVVLMGGLTYFVSRTQLGRAMRATSFDRQAAEMMGIDVNRVIAATFFIGSALAGAAGVFNCLVYQQVWYFMGFNAGLKAFTAAVVGGIGSLPGAVVGGLAIGLTEAFATGYLSSTFQDAIVFVILIAVMILRPSGLFGRAEVKKV